MRNTPARKIIIIFLAGVFLMWTSFLIRLTT